ncbi:MAG: redox-sensing transcriptional repressor Rex [Christensenellales bacterium]|jgi:redox-sensing transcriptional repressor
MSTTPISTQTLRRLPIYLGHLRDWTHAHVSATAIAAALNLSEIQVRKDLASISSGGKPGVGYETRRLIRDIEHYLGYDSVVQAVLVGAGNLGKALLGYEGFSKCGLEIIAAFDLDPAVYGKTICDKIVYPMAALGEICRAEGVRLGIITVPDHAAQEACNLLVRSGVRAVWNYAPTHLVVPEGVVLQNENLVASLTVLSRRLTERMSETNRK